MNVVNWSQIVTIGLRYLFCIILISNKCALAVDESINTQPFRPHDHGQVLRIIPNLTYIAPSNSAIDLNAMSSRLLSTTMPIKILASSIVQDHNSNGRQKLVYIILL